MTIAEARKAQKKDEKLYLDSYNQGWKDAVEFIEEVMKWRK